MWCLSITKSQRIGAVCGNQPHSLRLLGQPVSLSFATLFGVSAMVESQLLLIRFNVMVLIFVLLDTLTIEDKFFFHRMFRMNSVKI